MRLLVRNVTFVLDRIHIFIVINLYWCDTGSPKLIHIQKYLVYEIRHTAHRGIGATSAVAVAKLGEP